MQGTGLFARQVAHMQRLCGVCRRRTPHTHRPLRPPEAHHHLRPAGARRPVSTASSLRVGSAGAGVRRSQDRSMLGWPGRLVAVGRSATARFRWGAARLRARRGAPGSDVSRIVDASGPSLGARGALGEGRGCCRRGGRGVGGQAKRLKEALGSVGRVDGVQRRPDVCGLGRMARCAAPAGRRVQTALSHGQCSRAPSGSISRAEACAAARPGQRSAGASRALLPRFARLRNRS